MKKAFFTVFAAVILAMITPVYAEGEKFVRTWGGSNHRLYEYSDYLNGRYRSNFVCIPQNRMLSSLEGFQWKVGVFDLDGNTVYIGWSADGKGSLQLCDENKKMFIYAGSENVQEESFFRYENEIGQCIITEIELNGKKYTVAAAGISSSKAGIYSDSEGFRLWVENEAPKDSALSGMDAIRFTQNGKDLEKKVLNYESADILEGFYKPGWKRLWGTVVGVDESWGVNIMKYTYKDAEFICDWDNDAEKSLHNPNGSLITPNNVSAFYLWWTDKDGNKNPGYGIGFEADVQLGKNKAKLAVISYDGQKRVFVKDVKDYPVLQKKKTSAVKAQPAKKTEKSASKSTNDAAFTRDFHSWKRIYSKEDILKGVYKSNYKLVSKIGSKVYTLKGTLNGEEIEHEVNSAIYDLGEYQVSLSYDSKIGWNIYPERTKKMSKNFTFRPRQAFTIDDMSEPGREATVILDDKTFNIALVSVDPENADYRLFLKKGPNEETARNEKDIFDIEYFDCVDVQSGVYKPGFNQLQMTIASDASQKALFEDVSDNNPVFLYEYNGTKFLVGPAKDPADYVRTLDGTVLYNPENQIRYMLYDSDGNTSCQMGKSNGWEGKVKLGDEEVVLAVFKLNYLVNVFVKEK